MTAIPCLSTSTEKPHRSPPSQAHAERFALSQAAVLFLAVFGLIPPQGWSRHLGSSAGSRNRSFPSSESSQAACFRYGASFRRQGGSGPQPLPACLCRPLRVKQAPTLVLRAIPDGFPRVVSPWPVMSPVAIYLRSIKRDPKRRKRVRANEKLNRKRSNSKKNCRWGDHGYSGVPRGPTQCAEDKRYGVLIVASPSAFRREPPMRGAEVAPES